MRINYALRALAAPASKAPSLFLVLLLTACIPVRAAMFPRYDIHTMCAEADAIVLGQVKKGDTVVVEQWLLPPSGNPSPHGEIAIENFSKLSLDAADYSLPPKLTALPATRFVAFLTRVRDGWQALFTDVNYDHDASGGVIWIYEEKLYLYIQVINPGQAYLFPRDKGHTRFFDGMEDFTGEATLRATIQDGLKARADWQRLLAEPDAERRAAGLVAYMMRSTSPVKSEALAGRPRGILAKMGPVALPALLREVKAWRPGDDLTQVLYTISDLEGSKSAVPTLLPLLDHPEIISPYCVIEALSSSGDSSVIPTIEPFLKNPAANIREVAAKAIGRIRRATIP